MMLLFVPRAVRIVYAIQLVQFTINRNRLHRSIVPFASKRTNERTNEKLCLHKLLNATSMAIGKNLNLNCEKWLFDPHISITFASANQNANAQF